MIARRAAAALAVAAMLLGISACAPATDPGWEPTAWPVIGTVTTEPASAADAAPGTVDQRLRNDTVGIDARWSALPGDQPINDVIEKAVRDAVAVRSDASGAAYRPEAFPAGAGLAERGCTAGAATELAADVLGDRAGTVVVCEVTVARGAVFAETLRTVIGSAGFVTSDSAETVYTDLSTGVVGTASDLFADVPALWTEMVDVLRRDAGACRSRACSRRMPIRSPRPSPESSGARASRTAPCRCRCPRA